MRSVFFCLFFLLCSQLINSQTVLYAAARNGLSIRQDPSSTSAVLDKLPYGQKIEVPAETPNENPVSTEGFRGNWVKVTYNGKTGFIVNSYLLPLPPPKAGTKDLREYLSQVGAVNSKPMVLKYGKNNDDGIGQTVLTKQWYTNGAEWHVYEGYEYGSETTIIPQFNVQQAYLLLRLIKPYPLIIGDADAFPIKNATVKKANSGKSITVEKEVYTESNFYIKKIKYEVDDGVIYSLEIYELDNQAVIYFNGGV